MKQFLRFFFICLFLLLALKLVHQSFSLRNIATWKLHSQSSGFQIRDSAGEIVKGRRAYVFGGYTYGDELNDLWVSQDFRNWALFGHLPCQKNTSHPLFWSNENQFYLSCTNGSLFKTNDFLNWRLVDRDPPWSNYFGTCVTRYAGKTIVVTGYGFHSKTAELFISDDNYTWEKKALESISVRECHSGFFVFKDQLFLIGGRSHQNRWQGLGEIYRFDENLNPVEVAKVPWNKRFWETYIVTEEFVLMAGGYHRPGGKSTNFSDVWVSTDGIQWIKLKGFESFRPRHEASLYEFNGSIFLTAGHAYPLQNDVWRISKKDILEYIERLNQLNSFEKVLLELF